MDEPLKQEMRQMKEDIREIKTAIIGNPDMAQKGLVHNVRANSDYIEKDKRFKNKAVGILAGVQLAIGALLALVKFRQ